MNQTLGDSVADALNHCMSDTRTLDDLVVGLGDLLIAKGIITVEELDAAFQKAREERIARQ